MKNKKTVIVVMTFLAVLIVALFGVAVYALKENSDNNSYDVANYDPTARIEGMSQNKPENTSQVVVIGKETSEEAEIGISIIGSKETTEKVTESETDIETETESQTTEVESEETSDEDELAAFESERESYEAYIKELESKLSSAAEETAAATTEKGASEEELKTQIAQLQKQLEALESQSVSADDIILSLNSQVIGVSGQNATLNDTVKELSQQISTLQSQLANEHAQKESYAAVASSAIAEAATKETTTTAPPTKPVETEPVTQPAPESSGFNYLAIGNSITIHPTCDYWWNVCGMAASTPEKDYVHIVSNYLINRFGEVHTSTYNYAPWELQANDRAETFVVVDPYLSEKLDLVTIQLGENATNIATFRTDLEELIRHIKKKCPNAQIIVIDDFWENADRAVQKKSAAANTGVSFADLSAIRENPSYMCGMGSTVYDIDGDAHVIEHAGVARHPGDRGMSYIATSVINLIK